MPSPPKKPTASASLPKSSPPEDLVTRTQTLAATLLANSPASLRATKRLLAEQNELWLTHALQAAAQANAAIRQTPDFHEGIAAFLEKRPPTLVLTQPS